MKRIIHFALVSLFLLGISSAQNIPEVDVFGGYSYLSFELPADPSSAIASTRLGLNGWDASVSFLRFHHFSAEGDFAGHTLTNCDSTTFNCSNFSYMFGPRYNFGSGKLTFFAHGLVGQDRATLAYNGTTLTDTSISAAVGVGADYWVLRHVGVQLGPIDYNYARHLSSYGSSQNDFRAAAGVAFRFGGDTGGEPSATKAGKASRAPSSSPEVSSRPSAQPSAQLSAGLSGRGMAIASLGVAVVPQEFDGAKIIEIDPNGVGAMASMKVGDLIKTVDGKPVRTPMELLAELSDKNGKVKIGIQRGDFSTETLILLNSR
jgi:hypothetical protein